MKIALGDIVFIWLEPVVVAREKDTLALAASLRFNNKSLCFTFVKLLFEVFDVGWEHPRFGKELKLLRKVFLH